MSVSTNSMAIGNGATIGAAAQNSIAQGTGATVANNAQNAIALGNGANAAKASAIAIGNGATAGTSAPSVGTSDTSGIAIGGGAWSNWGVAIGDQARTSTDGYGVSIGRQTSTGLRSTALGFASISSGTASVAIGDRSEAQTDQSVAIGAQAIARGGKAVSIGAGNTANGDGAVAIGDPNNATGAGAVAQGKDNTANGDGAVAIGNTNNAVGQGSVALGIRSTTTAAGGVALGDTAAAKARNAMALGSGSAANNANDVALGAGSTTSTPNATSSATIAGTTYSFQGTMPGSVVSVGSAANERQITNVAAGQLNARSTDAVNGSQLYATNTAVTTVNTHVNQLGGDAAARLGGGASYDSASGTLGAPTYNVAGGSYNNVGDALIAVNGTANRGWNVQANGDTATQVKPGDTVQLRDGQNIKVTRNGTDITVATADDLVGTSLTTGNSRLDTNGLAIANGPSVLASGINAGSKKITNVADGSVATGSTDAVNGSQLYATNQQINNVSNGTTGVVQRTSATDVTTLTASGGTAANPGNAQKLTNLAAATLSAASTDAVNGSQLYTTNQNVATAAANTSTYLGGGANVANGTAPTYNVAGGSYNNVGDALIAVNGTANRGWNVQANGDTATQVKPGDTVQLRDGQNIKVTRNGTDITVATADDLVGASLTTGNSRLDTNGLAIANGPSVLASGINAGSKKITNVADGSVATGSTDAVNGSQLYATNQQINNVSNGTTGVVQRTSATDVTTLTASGGTAANPGNAQKLTNLAAATLSAASTDAVNGSQLYTTNQNVATAAANTSTYLGGGANVANGTAPTYNVAGGSYNNVGDALIAVNGTANRGWNVQANGDTATQVKPGDTVQLRDGQNIKVTRNGTDITVATADDLVGASLTTGNSRLDTNGLAIANGPSVLASGINAGSKKITNVADGSVATGSTDAVNGSQLYATNQQINNVSNGTTGVVQRTSATDVTTLTASGGTAANPGNAQKLTNLAAATLSAASTDAVNGSQLYTTNQNVATAAANTSTYLGGGANVANGTAPTYNVAGGSYNNVGSAISAINGNLSKVNNGSVGIVQRTGNADETVLTASGGTAANPGNAQKLTNLAAGTVSASSNDAINGSQLSGVSESVAKALGAGLLSIPMAAYLHQVIRSGRVDTITRGCLCRGQHQPEQHQQWRRHQIFSRQFASCGQSGERYEQHRGWTCSDRIRGEEHRSGFQRLGEDGQRAGHRFQRRCHQCW
ncbi:hypothetical protein GCM10020258_38750 [Sphingomonas yabuuchiae]